MDYLPLNLPIKEHLTIRLSVSALQLLKAIVKIAEESKSPVIIISTGAGPIRDSYVYRVKSADNQQVEEISPIYGVPKEELVLFKFILPLAAEGFHITALAFERVKYNEASSIRKWLLRATPLRFLIAITVTILSILLAILTVLLGILTNLQQLTRP